MSSLPLFFQDQLKIIGMSGARVQIIVGVTH